MIKKFFLLLIAIICIVSIYALFLRKDLTLSQEYIKEKYTLPNSKFIKWKGAEIHYTESGSGFPILMIHGFGGSHRDFQTIEPLFNKKYRVIRVDVPGFALSQFPKTNTKNINYNEIYNEYFDFIIDTLNLDSFYVLGNSLGGLMSWNLTLHQPNKVKKLVLLNSAGYDMKEVMKSANAHRFKNPIFKLLMKKGIPKFITAQGIGRVFYEKSTLTDEKIQRVNDFWNKEGNLQQIINMANSNQFIDEQLIKNIKVPTLIIWGKEDIIVSPKYAEKFHQDIQNSELIIYEKCGHVPMLEAPDRVYQDVQTFFDK
jgi:pimeloyl-ACP methyl ester carboxylesterase